MNKALACAAKETLLKIKSQVIEDGFKTSNGICGLYEMTCDRSLTVDLRSLKINWQLWPDFSGNPVYPIHSYGVRNPETKFWSVKYHWNPKTKYGQARMELLDWLIEQCDNKLKESI